MEYIKTFNQIMDEFFNELIEIFPEESKIKVQYNLFQTLCKTNIRKPCNEFMIGSIPYLEKIAMRDEEFFIGVEQPKLLKSMNFNNLWLSGLSDNSKDAIWKYIKSFFIIGSKAVEMPPETVPLINYIINNSIN
jgi:hypothetical protein